MNPLKDKLRDSVGGPAWNSVWGSVADSARGPVRRSAWNSVWYSVEDSVWLSVAGSVRWPLREYLREKYRRRRWHLRAGGGSSALYRKRKSGVCSN